MKELKCLAASLFLFTVVANANPVAQSTAITVAGNYYSQAYNATAQTLTLAYTESSSDGQPVYYVFNVGTNNGFVIVSAEDAGYPIIGSSNTGQYVIPTANNNIGFWMTHRKNEIIAMRTANVQASADISAEWTSYITNTPRNSHQAMSSVSPLLGGITWDQGTYYNAMCPGTPTNRSVTGCVATAMAQIMRYWSYPSVGLSHSCYYDQPPTYTENYGELCATFDTSHYVWSAMPAGKVTSPNSQVAKLMYDCGVSVDMDYSPTESGSYVFGPNHSAESSYVTYFNYDQYTITSAIQSQNTESKWVSLIETELNNGRPVQYQGTDSAYGGHSWVCDGYNTSPTIQFHMNWGWSGQDNGDYSPTDLNPGPYNFSYADVGAIIGIEPPPGALTAVSQVSENISSAITVYPNPSHGVFNFTMTNNNNTYQVRVYNVLGQEVNTTIISSAGNQINLSTQPKGVYIYKLMTESGSPVSTGRLVIE